MLRDEDGRKAGLKLKQKGSASVDSDVKMSDAEVFRLGYHLQTVHESDFLSHVDMGLLYEVVFGYHFQISLAGGIGLLKYMTGKQAGMYYTTEKKSTLNFPLELGLDLVPSRGFGLGIGMFANINKNKPVNGIFLKMDFGRRK